MYALKLLGRSRTVLAVQTGRTDVASSGGGGGSGSERGSERRQLRRNQNLSSIDGWTLGTTMAAQAACLRTSACYCTPSVLYPRSKLSRETIDRRRL